MFLFIFRRSWRGPITLESQLSQPYIGWCDRGGTGREPEQESKKQQRASDSNHLLTSLSPGKRFQSKREAWEVPRSVSGEVCRWKKKPKYYKHNGFHLDMFLKETHFTLAGSCPQLIGISPSLILDFQKFVPFKKQTDTCRPIFFA